MQGISYQSDGNFILSSLKKFIFFGFKEIPPEVVSERLEVLEAKGAKKLDDLNVEAYFVPSSLEKTHIVVFAHHSNLWQLHPNNYDHVKEHADVVLWNHSDLTTVQYQKDLQAVIEKVRSIYASLLFYLEQTSDQSPHTLRSSKYS